MIGQRAALAAAARFSPETAHHLALLALRAGLSGGETALDDPILATTAFGKSLPNPIGLAAGFDKNAVAVAALGRLGFGFVEAGTVTRHRQAGNPRPRLFRLREDNAVINRMGFNNAGIDAFVARLRKLDGRVAIGANIGINKENAEPARDYPALAAAVAPFADYIVINVSSPNTPGLRDLQGEACLDEILGAVSAQKPIFVKIAPDLSEAALVALVEVCVARRIAGLIVSNTTLARPPGLSGRHRGQPGGLSGAPLLSPSTAMLARVHALAAGRLILIGVGGIFSADDALAKILAGASLVQIYTSFAYQGPALLPRLKSGLASLLRARGFTSIAQAVGAGG